MYKILIGTFALLSFSGIYAANIKCPTPEQLRSEWSISSLRGIEQSNYQVTIYQKAHYYGTDKKWYVYFTVPANNKEEALKIAPQIIKEAQFIDGGTSPFGYYSCNYSSMGVSIYALSNKADNAA